MTIHRELFCSLLFAVLQSQCDVKRHSTCESHKKNAGLKEKSKSMEFVLKSKDDLSDRLDHCSRDYRHVSHCAGLSRIQVS